MVVSAAKLAANRRNAQKSTGPRTERGKRVSSLNAVTYGLRAETLVLPDEDPQILEDRRAAWRACLLPGDDVEERLVDDAVVYTWQQDRARRGQASRISANVTNYGVDQGQTNAKEVEDLGRRLFKDRQGPLVFYPDVDDRFDCNRDPSTSFAGKGRDDPDRPGDLVLSLQSTLMGCEWMLDEWGKLKAILDKGQPWVSSDKLKAVRLLGKQPFDAIDDRDVAMVFLASFVLKPDKSSWYWEIATELAGRDIKRFRNSAAARELDSLKPEDAAKAREALVGIIERATERLTKTAEAHRERARVMAALAPDILAFDDTPDGERLRRFDLASGRGLARSLGELRRHRREAVSGQLSGLSVVSGPLSVVNCKVDAVAEQSAPREATGASGIATNEPTVVRQDATNEPTSGPLSVVRCPLPVGNCGAVATDEANAPNKPTVACENVTNEPTAARENVTNEPTVARENVTNEPTAAREDAPNEPTVARENVTNEPTVAGENATNEPTGGPLSVVRCPLPVAGCDVEAVGAVQAPNEPTDAVETLTNEPTVVRENVTNEPTAACQIAPNELTLAADRGHDPSVELSAGTDHRNEGNFEEGFSVQEAESILKACERIRLAREEQVRELNEEARREAEAAMVIRRFRFGEQKNKNGKPAGQPNARPTHPGQNSKKEAAAPNLTELKQFVKKCTRAMKGEGHPPRE